MRPLPRLLTAALLLCVPAAASAQAVRPDAARPNAARPNAAHPSAPRPNAAAPNAARPAAANLALLNKSGQGIEELYVSSAESSGWGDDRLGDDTVQNNATFRLRLAEGCLYDLQVVYEDNRTEERMGVNLCRSPAQTFSGADAHAAPAVPTQEFTLDNRSGRTITAIAVADASGAPGEEDWGENLLTGDAAPGTQAKAKYVGECQAAVRVLFDNGGGEQRHSVDLCTDDRVLAIGPGWASQDESGNAAPAVEPAGLVTFTNRGPARLMELYLYPDEAGPDDAQRREERLGTRVLDAGANVQVALQRDGKCRFTVRAVFEGKVPDQVQPGIDFCPRQTVDLGTPEAASGSK